jgi:hypothetical protein
MIRPMSDVKGVRWTHVRKPEGGVTICLGYMRLQRRVPLKLHLSSRHDELFYPGCPFPNSDDGVKKRNCYIGESACDAEE